MSKIYVCQTEKKGRAVFSKERFVKGEIIERAPVIVLPDPEWELLEQTALNIIIFIGQRMR